jgi:hypothetical protein
LEKINNIDRPLTNVTKIKREKNKISKISNGKEAVKINTMEMNEIIREYFENLYSNKFDNHE